MIKLLSLIIATLSILETTNVFAQEKLKQGDIVKGKAQILDGDTLKINGVSLRLFGIDAPEKKQICTDKFSAKYFCGSRAALYLYDLTDKKTVSCTVQSSAGWGRYAAICETDSDNLNASMVQAGHALNYSKFGTNKLYPRNKHPNGLYEGYEIIARENKHGIWQGDFEYPWVFRKNK